MSDPVRLKLSADAPPLAIEALDRARSDAPDAARLRAIEAGVLAKLGLPPSGGGDAGGGGGPSAPSAGAPSAGAAGAGASAVTKAGAVALAAGVAIVALVVVSRTPDASITPPAVATRSAIDASPALSTALSIAEPGPPPISVEDLPAASAAPSALARAASSVRPAASEADPAASEKAEVALLAAAQAALGARPLETLARCDEHAARFASGTLVQEREVLAIDALLRLGRRPEAEARASRFRAAFPRSGHLRRIEALLAP